MASRVRKGATNRGGGVRLVPGLAVRAGQTLAGKYRVEELVGAGAAGVVLSARNIHLRERVTLKLLASYTDSQDELVARRLAKARRASRLRGSHVARIVDIGVTDDAMPYVATELVEGDTLEVELAERGHLEVEEAARWALEACEGLAEAHAIGLVHGDLKLQNVVLALPKARKRARVASVEPQPADARVLKLLDFGTTSPLDAIGDQSASAFYGSPAFLAPEQIQDPNSVDARADIWALGVLLYNMIAGSLPFEADSLSGVLVAVVYDVPALLTDAPYALARVVSRCLEKDASRRPQDVAELAEALAPFAGSEGSLIASRVRAALQAGADHDHGDDVPGKPRVPASAETATSSSVAPVSLSRDGTEPRALEPPPPTGAPAVPSVGGTDGDTRPSRRILARRRDSQARAAALALIAAAAVIALASAGSTRPARTVRVAAPTMPTEVPAPSAPLDLPAPPLVVTATPAALPDAPPGVSFAATAATPAVPTPLAAAPTPVADTTHGGPLARPSPAVPRGRPSGAAPGGPTTPHALPDAPSPKPPPASMAAPHSRAAPTPLPPPRARARATRPASRVPGGLPTTRAAANAASAAPSHPHRPKPSDTSLLELFTEAK